MPTRLIWPVFIFPRVSADGGEEDGNHDQDSGLPITITTQHRALIKGLSQCLNKYGGSAQVNLATCEWLDAHSELLPRRIHVQILNSSCDEFDIYESDPPMVLLQTMARHLGRSEIMSLSLCCYDGQFEDAIVQALRTLHIKEMILQGYVPADFADALKGIRGLQKICIKRAEHDALIEVDLRACPNVKVLEFREPQPSILALVEQLVLDLQRCCLERILFTGELNHVVRRGLEKWEGTLAVLKWTCTFSGRGPICWDRQEPLPQ
ncbi:hypothetical protein BC830DRAFT_1159922 [Chytriomyces sp. MP71]|nr:hypothetical protein BC830DRAFT_1159922 [Chytriomyces sp. MP71]